MARGRKKDELTEVEEAALGVSLAEAEPLDDFVSSVEDEPAGGGSEPPMDSPDWPDFAMGYFNPDELDPDGCPKVHGLRRVARRLLGPVLRCDIDVVQSPLYGQQENLCRPAVAKCTLEILMCRDADRDMGARPVVVSDVADAWAGNVLDSSGRPNGNFAIYLTALAGTRAESRAYRKALLLTKVAAEEKSLVPDFASPENGRISDTQLLMLGVLCKRLNVNVLKYVNAGSRRYASVSDVPYQTAEKMLTALNGYGGEPGNVPEQYRGYDESWQKNKKEH